MAKNLSTFAIAEMLHVDPGSVANWIDQKLLKAYRTPGGHRRVTVGDLVKFLREHNMPIPEDLDSRPACVLVVDDEPAITKLISRTIKAALPEVEVIEANDGFRAGSLVGLLFRPSRWSRSGSVLVCSFRSAPRAGSFARRWAGRLGLSVAVRRSGRGWAVSVPVFWPSSRGPAGGGRVVFWSGGLRGFVRALGAAGFVWWGVCRGSS